MKKKISFVIKTTPPTRKWSFFIDTMTGTNSSNDRLILHQNMEINSHEHFSYDAFFQQWDHGPRGLETSLSNHQEKCPYVQGYFTDLVWFIEQLSE